MILVVIGIFIKIDIYISESIDLDKRVKFGVDRSSLLLLLFIFLVGIKPVLFVLDNLLSLLMLLFICIVGLPNTRGGSLFYTTSGHLLARSILWVFAYP